MFSLTFQSAWTEMKCVSWSRKGMPSPPPWGRPRARVGCRSAMEVLPFSLQSSTPTYRASGKLAAGMAVGCTLPSGQISSVRLLAPLLSYWE